MRCDDPCCYDKNCPGPDGFEVVRRKGEFVAGKARCDLCGRECDAEIDAVGHRIKGAPAGWRHFTTHIQDHTTRTRYRSDRLLCARCNAKYGDCIPVVS